MVKTVYDFIVKDRQGKSVSLSEYEGKVLLIVNTGSDDEIHQFCTLKYATEFPQFKKIEVNGEQAEPLYEFLAAEKPFQGFGKGLKKAALSKFANMNNKKYGDKAYIKWNFTKFLIDRQGRVIARFEPTVDMEKVREAVEEVL